MQGIWEAAPTLRSNAPGSRNARGSQESGTVTKFRLRPDPCTGRFSLLELLLYGIAVLVVVAPELSRRLSNRFLGTS